MKVELKASEILNRCFHIAKLVAIENFQVATCALLDYGNAIYAVPYLAAMHNYRLLPLSAPLQPCCECCLKLPYDLLFPCLVLFCFLFLMFHAANTAFFVFHCHPFSFFLFCLSLQYGQHLFLCVMLHHPMFLFPLRTWEIPLRMG